MDKTIEAITEIIRVNHPHLLDGDTKIIDYCFWNATTNKELPVKKLEDVNTYKLVNGNFDLVLVIFFSDNTIGYRLNI
jgi:hypothetical protein